MFGGPVAAARPAPAGQPARGTRLASTPMFSMLRYPADWPVQVKAEAKRTKADNKLSADEKHAKIAELKLTKALQGLEKKLDEKGNYASGKVVVKGGKIEVAVYLYELSDEALAELKKLGFVKILESKAVKMVIGTVEVKKLQDLAWLDAVRRIDLPSFVQ